jgi:hypothetical protein
MDQDASSANRPQSASTRRPMSSVQKGGESFFRRAPQVLAFFGLRLRIWRLCCC